MSTVAPTRLCFGGDMKQLPTALCFSVLARALLAQGAPPQVAPDQPYRMEYYYKVQWGHQQEVLQLFLKEHYPLLKRGVASGRMMSVQIETPSTYMTDDVRWRWCVTRRTRKWR